MRKIHQAEGGVVYYLVAIFLIVAIGALSYSLNLSSSRNLQSKLQNAVDGAAQVASSTLCSTQACYANALSVAKDLIQKEFLDKRAENTLTLEDQAETTWSNGDTEVTIRRGRWWIDNTETAAYLEKIDSAFIHPERIQGDIIFEDFDAAPGEGYRWQDMNSETPAHLVANALYLKVKVHHKNSLLNIFNISDTPLQAEVYALSGDVSRSACVAPFALPICSLVDSSGEFEKQNACQIERYFTESKRYCSEGDDCDVLPGTLYAPFPKDVQREGLMSDFQFYHATTDVIASYDSDTNTPIVEYVNLSCDFNTRDLGYKAGNHYGVFGIPNTEGSIYTVASEENIQNLVTNEGCVQAFIGDKFTITHDGLTQPSSDVILWDKIRGSIPNTMHPESSRNVPFSDEFERSIFSIFFPKDESLFTSPGDKYGWFKTAMSCDTYPKQRYGLCNSKRFELNTECLSQRGFTADSVGEKLYTPEMLACPINAGAPTLDADKGDSARKSWDLEEIYNSTQVWKVAIPIISTAAESDRYCEGILDGEGIPKADDPVIGKDMEYFIVGFIDMIFYDTDIGNAPPQRLSVSQPDMNTAWNNQWDTSEEPWGFSEGSCNIVKGMIDCQQGLISTPQFQRLHDRNVRLVVP